MNKKLTIGCHNATFHSDELVAIALIKYFNLAGTTDIKVTRTRDTKVLDTMDMLVDVGGDLNADNYRFDHHQFEEDHYLYGLSSAGLVMREIANASKDLREFVTAVDARDTRVGYDESNVYNVVFNSITACNHIDIMGKQQDYRFKMLIDLVVGLIDALHKGDAMLYGARVEALEGLAESYMESKKCIFTTRSKSFVEKDTYIISSFFPEWRALSKRTGKPIVMLGDTPTQLKMMNDTSVRAIVSSTDEVFTHTNGFISVVKPKTNMFVSYFSDNSTVLVDVIHAREILNKLM